MITEIIVGLIGVLSTVVSSFITFILTKKKYNAEVDASVIQNLKESLEFYRKLSDDNKQRLDDILKRNEQLEDEVKELRKQVLSLMASICYDATCTARKLSEELNFKPDRQTKKATINKESHKM